MRSICQHCAIALGALCVLPCSVPAAESSIAKAALAVRFDPAAQTLSILDKRTGRSLVSNGKLEGDTVQASIETARDGVFGRGHRIRLQQAGGSTVALELYADLPFVLV